jgi:regulator of replication initiation timing
MRPPIPQEYRELTARNQLLESRLEALTDKLSESQKEIFALKCENEKLQAQLRHQEYMHSDKSLPKDFKKVSEENEKLSLQNRNMIKRIKELMITNEKLSQGLMFYELAQREGRIVITQTPGTQV